MRVSIFFVLLILIGFFSNIWLSQNLFAEEIKKEVPAKKILKMIENGEPVEIENAIITGELDLGKIELEVKEIDGRKMRIVKSKIRITDSTIQEKANFSYYPLVPKWAARSVLTKEVSFSGTEFQEGADFSLAQFPVRADFKGAQFQETADFWDAQFQETANFWGAQFHKGASFADAQFHKGASFWEAQFHKGVSFRDAQFQEEAFFADAQFHKGASFWGAQFEEDATFRGASFKKEVNFRYTDFQKMFIEWGQIRGRLVGDRPFYMRLIKNFEELGQFEDSDDAYYEYRVRKRRNEQKWYDPRRLLEYIFLDLSCGYGVRPFRAILYGVVLIFLFSGFYYQSKAIKERGNPDSKPRFTDALYFSVNTFTTVGYGDWYPTAEFLKIKGRKICRFRTLAMIEGFIGWLIIALFLVTLAKVWIR